MGQDLQYLFLFLSVYRYVSAVVNVVRAGSRILLPPVPCPSAVVQVPVDVKIYQFYTLGRNYPAKWGLKIE